MKVLNTQIEPTFIKKIKIEAESRELRILLQSEISVKSIRILLSSAFYSQGNEFHYLKMFSDPNYVREVVGPKSQTLIPLFAVEFVSALASTNLTVAMASHGEREC